MPFTSQYSEAQLVSLAFIPKVTAFLSCVFSSLIMRAVVNEGSKRSVFHRLLFGLSLFDFTTSIWLFMSTWPIPKDYTGNVAWAIGNEATCTMQGFFIQLGIACSFYNVSLSLYFLLLIVFNVKEDKILQIEWLLHTVPVFCAMIGACIGGVFDTYQPSVFWCWIGRDFDAFRWSFFYGPLWANIILITIICLWVRSYVSRIDKKAHRLIVKSLENNQTPETEESRELDDDEVEDPSKVAGQQTGVSTLETVEELLTDDSPLSRWLPKKMKRKARKIKLKTERLKSIANMNFLFAFAFYANWAAISVSV